ncbi:MAG TPA: YceI family protein [Candidatus Polarisedimenticolia bacterium]|nr:YceI family protein [Candidatus Polarisedimenticolia bacterium]
MKALGLFATLGCIAGLAAFAAEPPVQAPAPAAGVRTFKFDAAGSKLGFTVTRPGEVVEGTATQFSGTVRIDPEHPDRGGSVALEVDAATMVTGNRLRDRTMRNSHLETGTYPKVRFQSSSAGTKPDPLRPGEKRPVDLQGKLDLHGVTRTIKFPVTVGYDGALLTADGTVSFTLSEFSIPIPKILWFVLDDKVTVTFHAVAKPESR